MKTSAQAPIADRACAAFDIEGSLMGYLNGMAAPPAPMPSFASAHSHVLLGRICFLVIAEWELLYLSLSTWKVAMVLLLGVVDA